MFLNALAKRRQDDQGAIPVKLGDERDTVDIPSPAMLALVNVLDELADGHRVQVLPVDDEIGTQETADILNVSRPYVVKLLDEQQAIPFRKVGRERRMRLADVLAYKHKDDTQRHDIADELTREARELSLGY
jgi:excisionase family DNA binding protein